MGLFDKVKTSTKTEEVTDRVGGGFTIHESDVYDAVIKRMYAMTSDAGAIGVTLELDLFTDPESDKTTRFTKTVYVTDSEGNNFYSGKEDKKYMNSGWLLIDAIAVFATDGEAGLGELETEEVFVKRQKDNAEITVTAEGYPEATDLEIKVGILKLNGPKQKKVDGKWVDTDELQDSNELDRVFNVDGLTLLEWEGEKTNPEFMAKWVKQWQGKTKAVKPKTAPTAKTGGSGRNAGATRGAGKPERTTNRPSRFTRK